jgi:hypothetical protein
MSPLIVVSRPAAEILVVRLFNWFIAAIVEAVSNVMSIAPARKMKKPPVRP